MNKPDRDCSALRKKKLDVRCIRARLGSTERGVLDALRAWENFETGEAYSSQEMLALQTNLSREKVNRALKRLRTSGLFTTRSRPGTKALAYVIVDTEKDPDPNKALGKMLKERLAGQPSRRRMVTHDHHTMVTHDHHGGGDDGDPRSPYDGDPRSPEVPLLKEPIERTPLPPVVGATVQDQVCGTCSGPRDPTWAALPVKTAPRARAARESTEPGFGVLEACRAVYEASKGSFPKFEKVHLSGVHTRALRRLVQDFPDRTDWTVLGEHIATGAYTRWGVLGLPWLIRYARSAMAQAKDWKQRQQPPERSPGPARTRPEPTFEERQASLRILRTAMDDLKQRAVRAKER